MTQRLRGVCMDAIVLFIFNSGMLALLIFTITRCTILTINILKE